MSKRPTYFYPLDALRGILALTVALFHVPWDSMLNRNAFVANGYLAVDVFFCLSGFLMFTLYGQMSRPSEAGEFLKRRFARIYPLHLFTLLVFLAYEFVRILAHHAQIMPLDPGEPMPLSAGADNNVVTFFSNLALTQALGIHDSLTFNPPAWSISAEFYTYIIFAALMCVAPLRHKSQFVVLGFIAVVLYAMIGLNAPDLDVTYDYGLARSLAGFAIGICIARMFAGADFTKTRFTSLKMSLFEAGSLASMLAVFMFTDGIGEYLIAPIMALTIYVFAKGQGLCSRILSVKPLLYLGKISYSVYLVHNILILVMSIVLQRLPPEFIAGMPDYFYEVLTLAYIAGLIVVSHFAYHWVEVFFGKKLRNFKLRPKTRSRRGRSKQLANRIATIAGKPTIVR